MDTTFKETAASPDADPGDLQDAIVASFETADRAPGGANLDTKHLAASEGARQESGGANLEPQHLQDAAVAHLNLADYLRRHASNCAACGTAFEHGEQRLMIDGRLYHGGMCADYAKTIAIATR